MNLAKTNQSKEVRPCKSFLASSRSCYNSFQVGEFKAVRDHKAEYQARGFSCWGQFVANALLPSWVGAYFARDMRRIGQLRGKAETSRRSRRTQEIHACLCQQTQTLGPLPSRFPATPGKMPNGNPREESRRKSFDSKTNSSAWIRASLIFPYPSLTGPNSAAPKEPSSCICSWTTTAICRLLRLSQTERKATSKSLARCVSSRELCLSWIEATSTTRGSVKATLQAVYFVTRLKDKASFDVIEDRLVPEKGNILKDQIVFFS